jgi:hypothetical protein
MRTHTAKNLSFSKVAGGTSGRITVCSTPIPNAFGNLCRANPLCTGTMFRHSLEELK